MPELPDVERERRFLAEHAVGRRVRRVVVSDAGILRNAPARALDRALRGHRIEEPGRHGKWLIAWTTGPAVLFHFGMTGALGWGDDAAGRHRHDRVILELEGGELRYRNMRKLGGVWLAHGREDVERVTAALGPDALALDRDRFEELLARRRGRAKAALLDQTIIAGVGNLVADEALWQARIHPASALDRLEPRQLRALHRALHRVLTTWIERHDRVPRGWLWRVRGRAGAECPRCGSPLERTVVGGRTTWLCPRCQPAPAYTEPR